MNIFKPYLGQNVSVYIQKEKKKRKHINGIYYNRLYSLTYIAGGASFQLRSVCKESEKAIRRMESRSAKLAECGFPHLKPHRRNRAPELRNVASHEGYLKLRYSKF